MGHLPGPLSHTLDVSRRLEPRILAHRRPIDFASTAERAAGGIVGETPRDTKHTSDRDRTVICIAVHGIVRHADLAFISQSGSMFRRGHGVRVLAGNGDVAAMVFKPT